MPVTIAGTTFPNPVGIPAGWIDVPEKIGTVQSLGVGIITTKTITRYPREGNPYPRLVREGDSLVNSMGLPNFGLEWWTNHYQPPETPVIISIKGDNMQEWEELIEGLENKTEIFELNFSCPNVGKGVMDLKTSEKTVRDIASITDRKIFLKLSPEFSGEHNIELVKKVHSDISGITAINTQPVKRQKLGNPNKSGGLSGRVIYNQLRAQLDVFRSHYPSSADLPILATGGIFDPEQAWNILRNYKAAPMGLTGMLVLGPWYYNRMLKFIENKIEENECDLNSTLNS